MNIRFFMAVIATSPCTAFAANCLEGGCAVGDHATTYATKVDSSYSCPTEALSNYANFVDGLGAFHGRPYPRSAATLREVESSSTDKTSVIIEMLRKRTGVSSIDAALAACKLTTHNMKVIIVELPDNSSAVKVTPSAGGTAFWLPKAMVDR